MPAHAAARSLLHAVAALPALPLGKGAVILILGGLVALVISLAWSLLSPRAVAAPHVRRAFPALAAPDGGPSGVAAERVMRVTAPTPEVPRWLQRVSEATRQMGFGDLRIVGMEGARVFVELTACRSCQTRGHRKAGCALEARSLARAMRAFAPLAAATEVRCHGRGQGPCVFELRPEGQP